MNAALAGVEKRPFDMDAYYSRNTRSNGFIDGFDGCYDDKKVIAYQRRQHRRRAEPPVCLRYRTNAAGCWLIVE